MHVLVEIPLGDAELLTDQLWAAGAVGVEERETSLVGAFTDGGVAAVAADRLGGTTRAVEDTFGLDGWRDHASPVRWGPFVVRPPWLPADTEAIDLMIDPAHTFGAGSHPSTGLALRLLADRVRPGDHVLDLGAGSGILAVAAARLGARVTAIDIDPAAPATIAANAERNGVADRVVARVADLTDPGAVAPPEPAGLAVLNVTVDIQEQVAPTIAAWRIDTVVVAGILAGPQEGRVVRAHGRTVHTRLVDGDWAGLALEHGGPTASS